MRCVKNPLAHWIRGVCAVAAVIVATAKMTVLGVTNYGQRRIRVPADTLVDIRGGHCVWIDRVRGTFDQRDWEI
jgi:hypothetical protein